jgi:hypothetical protein
MSAIDVRRARFRALTAIDAAAGAARKRYITDVPGQQAVYLVKLQEAEAYLIAHAANAEAPVPPYIAAEATALGQSAIAVATNVAALASFWNGTVGPSIEGARLGGKAAVAGATGADEAATIAALEAARDAAVAALEAI